MLSTEDAKETCRLLVGDVAETWDFFQLSTSFERTVLITIGNDVRGDTGVESSDVSEQLARGCVYFHTDAVHTTNHRIIEAGFQEILIHVVLILADSDTFGIELNQLSKWVHESTTNGNSTTDGDIFIGKFFTGDFTSRVDGST